MFYVIFTKFVHVFFNYQFQKHLFMRNGYLPNGDDARVIWLNNFATKFSTPAILGKYGFGSSQAASVQADAAYFEAIVKGKNQQEKFLGSFVAHKNALRNGLDANEILAPLAAPTLTLPAAVMPGIFERISELVAKIKGSTINTGADNLNLGIQGTVKAKADIDSAKPALTLAKSAGQPRIEWVRKAYTAIEIQKDRGDGNWVFLAIDTVPDYIDTEALPITGTFATWSYRARYRKGDDPVGMWSDPVHVHVTTE